MTPEPLLRRLREDIAPSEEQRARVFSRIQSRMNAAAVFEAVKNELTPSVHQRSRLWNNVLSRIDVPQVSSVLDRLKSFFEPSGSQQYLLRDRLMSRLAPAHVRSSYVRTKWVAASVLVLVALRASPVFFLAPSTIAESTVIVVPTKGEVELALHDLWQPATGEVTINHPIQLRTANGEATVLLHDDGTVRLDIHTTLALHDLSDRPEPALEGPTMTLSHGRIWLQGLLSNHLRGMTVATPYGDITVHGGSVSISLDETSAMVRAWDRHTVIAHAGTEMILLAGERARFGSSNDMSVTTINDNEYDDAWVTQNLQRDAVHQREVAQMQQERRAAQAGILPNSPLYAVKRVAEQVDMLLTLDPESKVQKQLGLASTRLNEAAGLIAEGSEGADVPLGEYKQALLNIASGTGGDSITQFLLRQEVAENTADVSAALPDDAMYQIKRTVLEASAQLPVDTVDASDVEGIVLVDTLDVLHQAIEVGDTMRAQEMYDSLEPYLSSLEENALKPNVKKEVLLLLSNAAEKLEQQSGTGVIADELIDELKPYLPSKTPVIVMEPLTDEQIDAMIERIRGRIFVFTQPRSRWNQLQYEIKQLSGHPDEGRILRRLYHALPEDGLGRYVRPAIRELREETEQ